MFRAEKPFFSRSNLRARERSVITLGLKNRRDLCTVPDGPSATQPYTLSILRSPGGGLSGFAVRRKWGARHLRYTILGLAYGLCRYISKASRGVAHY